MKTLLVRTLDAKEKKKLSSACDKVIDLLREDLHLEPWECYYVCKVLIDEFPTEELAEKKTVKETT